MTHVRTGATRLRVGSVAVGPWSRAWAIRREAHFPPHEMGPLALPGAVPLSAPCQLQSRSLEHTEWTFVARHSDAWQPLRKRLWRRQCGWFAASWKALDSLTSL